MRADAVHAGSSSEPKIAPVAGMARERSRRGPPRRSLADRLWEKVERTDGCWLWTGHTAAGYGRISTGGRNAPMMAAHRAAWELVNGPIPKGMVVCHRCDNPRCCRAEPGGAGHLFLGTQSDNMIDASRKGRLAKPAPTMNAGEANGRAKLSASQVEEIRSAYGQVTAAHLARVYGVSKATVYAIGQGRIWRSRAA